MARNITGAKKEDIIKNLSSSDNVTKHNAILAIGELNDPELIPHIEKLCNDGDPATRYFAKKTIKKIKDSQHKEEMRPIEEKLEENMNLEFFRNSIFGANAETRLRILKQAALDPKQAYLPILVERIAVETDPFAIATIVKLIGKLGTAEHIDLIKKFLVHEDLRVRANAIEGLELIGSERIIPFIVPFLNDLDNRIKANAVKALAKFSQVETLGVLGAMIKSEQLWMRDSAVFALSNIDAERAIDLLKDALYDREKTIANHALQGLIKSGTPKALKYVDEYREKIREQKSSSPQASRTFLTKENRPPAAVSEKPEADIQPSGVIKTAPLQQAKPEPPKAAPEPVPSASAAAPKEIPKAAAPPQKTEDKKPQAPAPVEKKAHEARPVPAAPHEEIEPEKARKGEFEKLKSSMAAKDVDPINVIRDENSIISSNFKVELDDNFYIQIDEIKYIALATDNSSHEKKRPAAEKKDHNIDMDPSLALQPKSAGGDSAKAGAELKKKMILDQLKGARRSDGKDAIKK